ncbi:RNA-binding cell elongation regulator Jag/EloR [Petrocella sp. FN5]|uniref:RNA-binding cell elongation regulator Jag/EloR n=1 Tax=Petrocella sp. FN5 TaxID=3032002 RepID=UPI0023DCC600|nr:RNA-binding cell elongation regulator Jag/EloR [Petrocella sp. FN5]MDF1617417.1 protein jag [Petrocella sp. FN5]
MKYVEKQAKTVEDAITEALVEMGATSDQVTVEVIEKGPSGLMSIFSNKLAKVRVYKKINVEQVAYDFLEEVFQKMNIEVNIQVTLDDHNNMTVDLSGPSMGVLIGKRGQTLDSLQYLVSLVVNKEADSYMRVKLDTENYRDRRKETLETLAKNLAHKVKITKKKFILEPMNPYERRIIHSTLQNNKNVETHSEGDEPYRKVVITPSSKNTNKPKESTGPKTNHKRVIKKP